MATPLSSPAAPIPVSPIWRIITGLPLVRRLLGVPEEQSALADRARASAHLGPATFDWDGPDTSLTQAELEVLK
ncbi:MAG TPA: hypothetical protein VFN91_14535 [Myxococcaceae bacterium]|nr:hypothetical protein [Myxococcaceae bacterium]